MANALIVQNKCNTLNQSQFSHKPQKTTPLCFMDYAANRYCFVRTEMSDNVIFSCCLFNISLFGTVLSVKKINPKCLSLVEFTQIWEFFHYSLSLMSFQTCMLQIFDKTEIIM